MSATIFKDTKQKRKGNANTDSPEKTFYLVPDQEIKVIATLTFLPPSILMLSEQDTEHPHYRTDILSLNL